jgi:hypothetical protein
MREMGMCETKEVGGQRPDVRERLIFALIVATIVASAITALTTGLTIWVSKLPVISPASLSLAVHSWSQIIHFNLEIWLCAFVIFGVVMLIRFSRWFCVDLMS